MAVKDYFDDMRIVDHTTHTVTVKDHADKTVHDVIRHTHYKDTIAYSNDATNCLKLLDPKNPNNVVMTCLKLLENDPIARTTFAQNMNLFYSQNKVGGIAYLLIDRGEKATIPDYSYYLDKLEKGGLTVADAKDLSNTFSLAVETNLTTAQYLRDTGKGF